MGGLLLDNTTTDVLVRLNKRFSPDDLIEMVALQKEFGIFSSAHSLRQSFALLGIVPTDRAERDRWYRYLDKLQAYRSDVSGCNGHDRIVRALASALEAEQPMPVHFGVHRASDDDRITITTGHPVIFSLATYFTISIPTTPSRVVREQAAEAARKRRAERKMSHAALVEPRQSEKRLQLEGAVL